MAAYCYNCAVGRNWPRSPVRTGGRGPCEICGEFDPVGRYSYPDALLPGMPGEINATVEREARGDGGGGSQAGGEIVAPATKGV